MLSFKWYLVGFPSVHQGHGENYNTGNNHARYVIYAKGDNYVEDVYKCIEEGKRKNIDYPDSWGCKLMLDVRGSLDEENMECDDIDGLCLNFSRL